MGLIDLSGKRALAVSAKWVALLVWFLACAGCGKASHTNASEPSQSESDRYNALVARLPQFEDAGWVVSRGSNTNQGDSLFFSGLALYALPCDDNAVADALETQLKTGTLVRYPGNKDAVSFDGALGLFRGLSYRMAVCNERDRWSPLLAQVKMDAFPLGFDYVRKRVLGGKKDALAEARLEVDATGFAVIDRAAKAACFRLNLALLSLQTVEQLGDSISNTGRAAFCDATRGARIAAIENWCGRNGLRDFLDNFHENQYIYAFQRCSAFEPPDANGDQEPGVDYLVGYRDFTGGGLAPH